jgi:hypothetical protein
MKISDQIAEIQWMTKSKLLDYVIANPHLSYRSVLQALAEAIQRRRKELKIPVSQRQAKG